MKTTNILVFALLLSSFLIVSCSKDDNEKDLIENVEGTVMGTVSCNTEGKGLAYKIVPDNFNISSGFIITATLPDELKEEGIKIQFDMEPSNKYITACTANFFPEQFYEILNVTVINN